MSDSKSSTPKVAELDDAWAAALADAEARARAAGRADLTDYLALRSSNDLLRKTACDWLLSAFRKVAGESNRAGSALQISSEDNYQFTLASTALVGRLLKIESGVRQLFVEVGWPRDPGHGFIRGGGLALGHLRHFGIKSASEVIRLVTSADGAPRWIIENNRQPVVEIRETNIRQHIAILLDNSRVDDRPF